MSTLLSALITNQPHSSHHIHLLLHGVDVTLIQHGLTHFSHGDTIQYVSDVFVRGWKYLVLVGCRLAVDTDERHEVALRLLDEAKDSQVSPGTVNIVCSHHLCQQCEQLKTNILAYTHTSKFYIPLKS